MPVDISQYRRLADQSGRIKTAGNTVHLSKTGDLVLGGNKFFSRVVSWFKGFRTRQHIATRNHFIEALNDHYGQFITSQATQGWVRQNSKKPMTTREVFIAFQMVDNLKSENKRNNEELASRYDVVAAEGHHTEPQPTSRLKSALSDTVTGMFADSQSTDAQQLQERMDIANVGEKIKTKILEKGDNGKLSVSKKEADNIAKQVIQDEAAKVYKQSLANEHFIFNNSSLSLSQRTVDHLNGTIEGDIMAEIYKAGAENPKFPSRARVAEIAQNTWGELPKFVDAERLVQSLNISDEELRTEVIALVAKSELSESQMKTAWEAGLQMRPHLKIIADASSTEKQLEKAINECTNAVTELETGESIQDIKDRGVQFHEQRSTLMMMAQGGDWRATMENMHQRITTPGALNSYVRATNHYRLSFPESDAYKSQEAKQPDFYRPSLRRADTFSIWMESLGFASAKMLDKPGGEAEVVSQSAPLESSSEIGDRTLNLMRNTGIKMPTPDRVEKSGEGAFSNAAVKYVEEQMADGKPGPLNEDDIAKQYLIDIGVRSTAYFNGMPASKDEAKVIAQLKEFCTTNGELNKDMMFAVSQFHQGALGAVFQVFKREQIAPVHGLFASEGSDKNIQEYHFNKNNDGSVSAKIIYENSEPKIFTPIYVDTSVANPRYQVMLDSDASGLRLDTEFLLTPDQFSAARDKFPPPKVTNLSYRYGLYEDEE